MISVRQMCSPNTGNPVANQFIITLNGMRIFQSYKSIIACIGYDGKVTLDSIYWDYSRTTSKYRNIFLDVDTKTTRANIKSGKYTLANLNNNTLLDNLITTTI